MSLYGIIQEFQPIVSVCIIWNHMLVHSSPCTPSSLHEQLMSHLSMQRSTERISQQVRDTPSTHILHVQLIKGGREKNVHDEIRV